MEDALVCMMGLKDHTLMTPSTSKLATLLPEQSTLYGTKEALVFWPHPLGPTMIPSWFPNFPTESKLKRKTCTQRISVNNSRIRHPPRKYDRAPDTRLIFLKKSKSRC